MLGELFIVDGEERLKIGEVVDHAFLTRDKGTTTKAMMNRLERELDSRSTNKRLFDDMKKRSEEMQATLETIVEQGEEIIDQNETIIDQHEVNKDINEETQFIVENAQQNQSHQQTQQDYNSISNQVIEFVDQMDGSREWMDEDQKERFHDITKMTIRASNAEEMKDCLELVEGLYEEIPQLIDEDVQLKQNELKKCIHDNLPHILQNGGSLKMRTAMDLFDKISSISDWNHLGRIEQEILKMIE